MTPMTTRRPTIVRTIEPPPGPDECVGWEVEPEGRCSGVFSPSAANATGAVSRQPRTAAPTGRRREGRLRINTEGLEPGSGSGLVSAALRYPLSGGLHRVLTPSAILRPAVRCGGAPPVVDWRDAYPPPAPSHLPALYFSAGGCAGSAAASVATSGSGDALVSADRTRSKRSSLTTAPLSVISAST